VHDHDHLLNQQIDYYRARANEYDQWFFRQERYDRGPELNALWFAEVEILHCAVETFKPTGDILELACGTGIWTEHLLQQAGRITAVDASPEALALNRDRTRSAKVRYIQADLFKWQPDRQYDVVFFAFWLSHVPPERFDDFWRFLVSAVKPNGRVFFLDSRYESTSTAKNHRLEDRQSTSTLRRLNDGREFEIVKVFYEPETLTNRLRALGWHCTIAQTSTYFLYGFGSLQQQ
jgi:2-polyprenyl-3-methyl-5-hydroxy-6-metoxy-1,4-benzoquinol methylase